VRGEFLEMEGARIVMNPSGFTNTSRLLRGYSAQNHEKIRAFLVGEYDGSNRG
jgi:hypothetical protein